MRALLIKGDMVLTGAEKSARFYYKDPVEYNRKQTLALARKFGRVPRASTLVSQRIDEHELLKSLREFIQANPNDSRATRKIFRYMSEVGSE